MVMMVAVAHRQVLWVEGLMVLLVLIGWLVDSLEPWLGREVVMTGYYLGRRESRAVLVILVHYHMQYSLVARVHRHGGPDHALVLGNVDCSPDQRHCLTSDRHHH